MGRVIDTEGFIRKAVSIHGTVYDYSKSNYLGAHKNIEIICPEHGSFWQTPCNHYKGKGCPKCGNINRGIDNRFSKEKPAILYLLIAIPRWEDIPIPAYIKYGVTNGTTPKDLQKRVTNLSTKMKGDWSLQINDFRYFEKGEDAWNAELEITRHFNKKKPKGYHFGMEVFTSGFSEVLPYYMETEILEKFHQNVGTT